MANKKERGVAPEILQHRADAIIAGYEQMISDGLPVDVLRSIEQQYSQQHRDILQIFLGLKPVAANLGDLFHVLTRTQDYTRFFPTAKDIGIEVMHDSHWSVWNPVMVEKIGRDRQSEKLLKELLAAKIGFGNPYTQDFSVFMKQITSENTIQAATAMAGQLYGYPRGASAMFAANFHRVHEAKDTIRFMADELGIKHSLTPNLSIARLIENREGVKNEILSLASRVGFPDTAILGYIKRIRYSHTPGTPFVTAEPNVTQYEREWMRNYSLSGIDRKLAHLLS